LILIIIFNNIVDLINSLVKQRMLIKLNYSYFFSLTKKP
jgi:hypothetical protein